MIRDMSILFSGGSDSTFATLIGLKKARRVHLLTFNHRLMFWKGKHKVVVRELKKVFGNDRIIEHSDDIDGLFKKCYLTELAERITKYRTFYIPWICGACKMAMHFKTIAYNLQHGISLTYDGANISSAPYFPAQTESYFKVMRRFYESYGMRYENPVFNITNTDKETVKYGVLSTKNTKKEHLFYTTQFTCYFGLLVHAHARFYYKLIRGKNKMEGMAGEFLEQMLNECKPDLDMMLL